MDTADGIGLPIEKLPGEMPDPDQWDPEHFRGIQLHVPVVSLDDEEKPFEG